MTDHTNPVKEPKLAWFLSPMPIAQSFSMVCIPFCLQLNPSAKHAASPNEVLHWPTTAWESFARQAYLFRAHGP